MSQGFTKPFGSLAQALTYIGPSLPNAKLINGFLGNCASGDNDLYTVPSGRRAAVLLFTEYNGSTSVVVYGEVKISGTYYQLNTSISPASSSLLQVSASTFNGYIAEGGETLAVNAASTGLNFWLKVIEFDNSSGLRTVKKTGSWSAGDNTLYTVPSDKTALLGGAAVAQSAGAVGIMNTSGSTRTYSLYAVPNGGSSGASNRFVNAQTILTAFSSQYSAPGCLESGDFIVINTDATTDTQFAFVTVYET